MGGREKRQKFFFFFFMCFLFMDVYTFYMVFEFLFFSSLFYSFYIYIQRFCIPLAIVKKM